MNASGVTPPRSFLRLALALAISLVVASAAATSPIIPRAAYAVTYYDADSDCGAELDSGVGRIGTTEGTLELVSDRSGADVACTVRASGDAFAVSGSVRAEGQYLTVEVPALRKDATRDAPSIGSIEIETAFTGDAQRFDDCSFYFVDQQLVDAGKVWATVECPELSVAKNDCAVQRVVFAWELCSGTADEADDGC